MNDLATLERGWDEAAEQNPLHFILSDRADWSEEDFFERGRQDVGWALEQLESFAIRPRFPGVALDFGCGVGRCTHALAAFFVEAHGVDLSSKMIRLAETLDRDATCRFHLNREPDLRLFGDESFDLIYTNLVLQHLDRELQRGYIAEFGRILRPGGIALIGLPTGGELKAARPCLSMFPSSHEVVAEWIKGAGLMRVATIEAGAAGGFTYYFHIAEK